MCEKKYWALTIGVGFFERFLGGSSIRFFCHLGVSDQSIILWSQKWKSLDFHKLLPWESELEWLDDTKKKISHLPTETDIRLLSLEADVEVGEEMHQHL